MADYTLSDDDRAMLLSMARQLQRDQGQDNTGQRPRVNFDADDHPAPECYVAKAPMGGIPALIGPGGIGTGTVGDEPGMAMCHVYRLQPKPGSAGVVELEPLGRSPVQVWNLGLSAIAANSWLLVTRDKVGSWWAIPTAVGSGGGEGTIPWAANGGGVSIGGSTWVAVTWPQGGPGPWFNNSSFIIQEAGTYLAIGSVAFAGSDPSYDYVCEFSAGNTPPTSLTFDKGGSCSLGSIRCHANTIFQNQSVGNTIALWAMHNAPVANSVNGLAMSLWKVG